MAGPKADGLRAGALGAHQVDDFALELFGGDKVRQQPADRPLNVLLGFNVVASTLEVVEDRCQGRVHVEVEQDPRELGHFRPAQLLADELKRSLRQLVVRAGQLWIVHAFELDGS